MIFYADDPNTHEQKRKGLDQKTIFLKSNIGDNDAKTKINMMLKWAKKGHRVRVVIGQAGEKGDAVSTQSLKLDGYISSNHSIFISLKNEF